MGASLPLEPVTLPAVQEPYSTSVSMFERLALDPSVDVDKLQRLIEMQERIMRHNAKAAFDAAYSKMQAKLPQVDERGRIHNKAGAVQSTYALLEDINEAIRPILVEFGFSIRYRTEYPNDKIIRTIGILSHEQGHSEESWFDAEEDKSDYRSKIQSQGSTRSYGRRYTMFDLLNIVTRGMDDDGQAAGKKAPPAKPAGMDELMDTMSAAADNGQKAVNEVWNAAKPQQREWLSTNKRQWLDGLKAKAKAVKA
jgi:hypothetical protein